MWQKQVCPQNCAYIQNIWYAYLGDVCAYTCHIWSMYIKKPVLYKVVMTHEHTHRWELVIAIGWIWLCQIKTYRIANCCPCESVNCDTGQHFWLIWPMDNSANALFIMWLMPVSSYAAYILDNFPHWCIFSNLGMWPLKGIFVAGSYIAIPW